MESKTPVFDALVEEFAKDNAYIAKLYGHQIAREDDDTVLLRPLPKFTEETVYGADRLSSVPPPIPTQEIVKLAPLPKRIRRPSRAKVEPSSEPNDFSFFDTVAS